MLNGKVRLGIIGFGAQEVLMQNLSIVAKLKISLLVAFVILIQQKVQVQQLYPNVPYFDSYQSLIKSGEVDAIVTTVPHYLHTEIGKYALTHEVHALLEKPADIYASKVQEITDLAQTKPHLTFGIFFNQRTNPLYQKVKSLIDTGVIGNIRRTNWIITTWWRPQAYYDQSAWRATWSQEGGGVLVNQAPHQIDLLQWLCGLPKSIFKH